MAAKKGTWIGGAAVASVAIIAAAWFLAVNPQMTQAADLREQTESVKSQNAALQDRIDQLKVDFTHLDEYKADLAEIRTQIPTADGLSEYLRELDAIAAANHVVVTTVSPSPAQAFVAAVKAAPAPTPEATPTDGASEPTPTADATPTDDPALTDEAGTATPAPAPGAEVPAGLADIPVSITVVGTYADTVSFVNALQTGTRRLFLVGGVTGTSQKQAEASGGRPATELGDQEMTITGFLYVLPDATAPAPDPSASPTPAPQLPSAPGRNPLAPVAGQ